MNDYTKRELKIIDRLQKKPLSRILKTGKLIRLITIGFFILLPIMFIIGYIIEGLPPVHILYILSCNAAIMLWIYLHFEIVILLRKKL